MSKSSNAENTSSDIDHQAKVPPIHDHTTYRSRPNGLLLLRREEESQVTGVLIDYDVVVVHGLLGERNPPWKNRGCGDSSWMNNRHWEGKRVLSFGYDTHQILAGRQTREAVRRYAVNLLDELKAYRENDTKRRPIAFLAHDIGGIIVKDVHSKILREIFVALHSRLPRHWWLLASTQKPTATFLIIVDFWCVLSC